VDAGDRLVITPADARVAVSFGRPDLPEDDPRTVVGVTFTGRYLHADLAIETLDGDGGTRWEDRDVVHRTGIGLGRFLRGRGEVLRPWEGTTGWVSLQEELVVTATCDRRGVVTVEVSARERPGEPGTWGVSASFDLPLGDLIALGSAVEDWFRPPYAADRPGA
jgi:hypothetical protein